MHTNFVINGEAELLYPSVLLSIVCWWFGEFMGLKILTDVQSYRKYSIIIETIGLFLSFFAIPLLGLHCIVFMLGFASKIRLKDNVFSKKTTASSFLIAIAISLSIPNEVVFAPIVALWIIGAKSPYSKADNLNQPIQSIDSILALMSGLLVGLSWIILKSSLGLLLLDNIVFIIAVAASHLLLPRQSVLSISCLMMFPMLLFYIFGLGFFHSIIDSTIGTAPWSFLKTLPIVTGIFLGMLSGLSIRFHPWSIRLFWVGCAISLLSSSELNPTWFIIVLLFWGGLIGSQMSQRALLLMAAVMVSGFSLSEKTPRGSGVWLTPHHIPNEDKPNLPVERWSAWGHHILETTEGMSFFVNESQILKGWSNGFRISTVGRQASSEYFVGRLASVWFETVAQVAILGDFTSNILSAYTHSAYQVHVHTPDPWLTRTVAELSESRTNKLLQSNVSLHNLSRRQILRQYSKFDLIIEAIHTPFDTIVQGRPGRTFFEWRKRSLSESGRAIFILHTSYWPSGSVQTAIASALDTFPHAQLWLPPNGVDDLILIVGNQPFDYTEFERLLTKTPPEALLNENIPALAARAIAGHAVLKQWTDAESQSIDGFHPSNSPTLPLLHVGKLHELTSTPESIWEALSPEQSSTLKPELDAKLKFLSILSQASEGQIQDVFLNASQLLEQGFGSQDALTTLVEPHLRDARNQIKIARLEGQSSDAWAEAARYATTARMLAPSAETPLLLLGEIAIGQGQIDKAKTYYESAYNINPENHATLDGLARIAGLQDDHETVEKWLTLALKQYPNQWRSHYNLGTFLRLQRRFDEAEARLRKSITLSQSQHLMPHLQLAELYLDLERNTRALLEVERALQIEKTAEAWYLRGRAYYNLSQWKKAEDDFRRATLSDPNHHSARGAVGLIQIEQGNLEGAAQTFRAVLRFDPKNKAALENLRQVEQEIAEQEATLSPP
ncbi:MAG: tetratricopeptide repeat protein [Myxococcota bacterium]|nr:tetratricopeptide repeat protein [Myxococcota bacterium]